MFTSFVDAFRSRVIDPAIDAHMRAMGEAGVARAKEEVPVRTGQLRDSIGYYYNQHTKILTLYADKYYASFVEMGTRRSAAHPFLRPAVAAMGRAWGGASVEVQFPTLAGHYHERTLRHARGRIGPATLRVGHRPIARAG